MSRPLPCGACGIESYDVQMKLVEIPEEERRLVPFLATAGDSDPTPIEVPERYVREPRCRDTVACADRVAAFTKGGA